MSDDEIDSDKSYELESYLESDSFDSFESEESNYDEPIKPSTSTQNSFFFNSWCMKTISSDLNLSCALLVMGSWFNTLIEDTWSPTHIHTHLKTNLRLDLQYSYSYITISEVY